MAILYDKFLSDPISNPAATLTYNFNKVILSGLDTSTQRYANIDLSFPGYAAIINNMIINDNQILKTLKTTSSSNNITYYDNVINSTKQYKINYIHVGISPINLSQIYSWCVMLDLTTNTSESLIVIIPITYLSAIDDSVLIQNEKPDFSKLVYNCNYSTNNAIDINTFMLSSSYYTIYDRSTDLTSKNRVIIFNSSISTYFYDVINSSKTTLIPRYIDNKYLNSTIYNTITGPITQLRTIPQSNTYLCLKLPIRSNDILQNDIYIDCYKVGESTSVVGGITNPSSVSKNKKGNSEVQLALFSIIIAFVMMYGVVKLYQLSNRESTFKLSTTAPFGFKYGRTPMPAV